MPDDDRTDLGGYRARPGSTPSRNLEPARVPDEAKINPLSKYSSYAYNLTLYILSPEAVQQFVITNNIPLNGQGENYYIVAQSGGINKAQSRAITNSGIPGAAPGLDYYIDNLVLEIVGPLRNSSPIAATEVSFDIIEPLGFTFLTKLSEASNRINAASAIVRESGNAKPNLFQQHYLLGIKFFGYDQNGNDITTDAETNQYQRYFPILISKVDYKIDGKPITYKVSGTLMSIQAAFGAKRGIVMNDSTLVARTIGQALGDSSNGATGATGLVKILNEELRTQLNKNYISKTSFYSIEWENSEIQNSDLIDQAAYDADLSAFNPAINTSKDATVAEANKSVSIDVAKKEIKIKAGTPIVKVIDNIITKSTYVTNKLREKNNAEIEVDLIASASKNSILNWFSISTKVYPLARDPKTNDWTYNITYRINNFNIPYLRSPLKNYSSVYHGAHKKYNYFLTGKNTEIISFEQTYDNHFYIIRPLATNNDKSDSSKTGGAPTHAVGGSEGSLEQGGLNRSDIPANAVRANLSSIADQATATIKILGDPDFLMDSIGNPVSFNSGEFSRWYGSRGYSINPMGGQIFIEIVFNLATDYGLDGIINVSDQVQFYSDASIKRAGIEGLVYWVTKVTNTFSKGLFTQELDLIYVPSELLLLPTNVDNEQTRRELRPGSRQGEVIRIGPDIPVDVPAGSSGDSVTTTPILNPNQRTDNYPRPYEAPNDDYNPGSSSQEGPEDQ